VLPDKVEVLVVGAGVAALCAAIEARENGAEVLLLEKTDKENIGANGNYTMGAIKQVTPRQSVESYWTEINRTTIGRANKRVNNDVHQPMSRAYEVDL